jgi:hypothetical protein
MGDGTFNAPKFGLFGATFHAADPYGMKGTICSILGIRDVCYKH